jgi:hypothetical protein
MGMLSRNKIMTCTMHDTIKALAIIEKAIDEKKSLFIKVIDLVEQKKQISEEIMKLTSEMHKIDFDTEQTVLCINECINQMVLAKGKRARRKISHSLFRKRLPREHSVPRS